MYFILEFPIAVYHKYCNTALAVYRKYRITANTANTDNTANTANTAIPQIPQIANTAKILPHAVPHAVTAPVLQIKIKYRNKPIQNLSPITLKQMIKDSLIETY